MQALQYHRPAKLNLVDLAEPLPGPDEVVVQVAYCGICGTDLHILKEEARAAARVVLGHEFSGTVYAVGHEVQHLDIGDTVAVDPNNFCGDCDYCRRDQVHFCQNMKPIGITLNGGWAQFSAVPASQVYKLEADIPLTWAALSEPISCIIHGFDRLLPLIDNAQILIVGAGIIGLLWAIILRRYQFNSILISEPSKSRRNVARNLGFDVQLPQKIITQKTGFDSIIDCSGNPQAIETCFSLLKPQGKLLLFGMCPRESRIQISPFKIFENEISVIGSVINPFTFARAIKILPDIMVPIEELNVHFSPLSDFNNAIQLVRSASVTKVFFKPDPA